MAYRARMRRAIRRASWHFLLRKWPPLRWTPLWRRPVIVPLPRPGFDRWLCGKGDCNGMVAAVAVGVKPDSWSLPLQVGLCAYHETQARGRSSPPRAPVSPFQTQR